MKALSVITPTYNRASHLRLLILALSTQTQPANDWELVVVDDGSTDETADVLSGVHPPFPMRVIRKQRSGQAASLNRGAREARGRFLLFLDDDVIPDPILVAEHLRTQRARLRSGRPVLALGRLTCHPPPGADASARSFAVIWNDHYTRLNRGERPPTSQDCYSGNLSVPRRPFLAAGGFDEKLPSGFDVELGYRLERMGLDTVYLAEASGEHADYKGSSRFLNDSIRQGTAAPELCKRHPELLPEVLGGFWNTTPRTALLVQLGMAFGISPLHFAGFAAVLPRGRQADWFRFLQTFAYWHGVRRSLGDSDMWQRLTNRTPILMYHAFGDDNEPASRYILPVRHFARQMAWLKRMGYRPLGLDDYLEQRMPPGRSVVITIDDGYADSLSLAYPILSRYGFPATLFVVTGSVGDSNRWDSGSSLTERRLLGWSGLEEWSGHGMGIGAHTRTHVPLDRLTREQVYFQVAGSRDDLAQRLNVPVSAFAYPYGQYDETVRQVVEGSGFAGGCGVLYGLNNVTTPRHELRRIEISGLDSLLDFAYKVRFGQPLPMRSGNGHVKV